MTTSFHLTFHAVRPAVTLARALEQQFQLDFAEQEDASPGHQWLCEGHVLADRMTVGTFTPERPHDGCPDQRHRSFIKASFTKGRARDRGARRDYLLRLLVHADGVTLVSQTFTDD